MDSDDSNSEKVDNKNSSTITSDDQNDETTNPIHFRHIMLYYFRKGKRINATANKICSVYGENAIHERTVGRWFKRFKKGQFNLEDQERSGRPKSTDEEKIKALVYENPRYSSREMGLMLGISKTAIIQRLNKFGYVNRNDVWVPKILDKTIMAERQKICEQLLKQNNDEPFLHRLIIGGEKYIIYNKYNPNNKRKRRKKSDDDDEQIMDPTENPKRIPGKALLSVWWDHKGLLYWELMEYKDKQLTSEHYCSQLNTVRYHIEQKRPELLNQSGIIDGDHYCQQQKQQQLNIIYQHDNIFAHKSEMTKEKLLKEFKWKILSHPSFSPDISPSIFHLFRSLQSSLLGKHYVNIEQIGEHLQSFFNNQTEKFWYDGIVQLPDRWQQVIQRNGAYVK